MGNAGWGYTSILILERALVHQLPPVFVYLSLKGTWVVRGFRYSDGVGGNGVAEGSPVDEEGLLPYWWAGKRRDAGVLPEKAAGHSVLRRRKGEVLFKLFQAGRY